MELCGSQFGGRHEGYRWRSIGWPMSTGGSHRTTSWVQRSCQFGKIVDFDLDLVTEVFDRPAVYREYLREDQRA